MNDIHSCSYGCLRPDCVRRARENLHYAQSLLRDWQSFAKDVTAADCAGQEWLDMLKARTEEILATCLSVSSGRVERHERPI